MPCLQCLSINISDGFVPIGKEEYEKKHDANSDLLEKAIDEVVAKQLDLGTIHKIRILQFLFLIARSIQLEKWGSTECENMPYLLDISSKVY